MPERLGKHRRDTNTIKRKGDETIFMEDTRRIKKIIQGERGLVTMTT